MTETAPQNHSQVVDRYRQRLEQQETIVKERDDQWSRWGYLRGSLFLIFLVPLILGFNAAWGLSALWWPLAGLLFLGFLYVAFVHEGIQRDLRRARLKSRIYRESIARCERDWDKIPVPKVDVDDSVRHLSADLDLFTDSSIFKLLGITRTPLGTQTLVRWIIDGADPEEVVARQTAAQELAPQIEWREDFQLRCEQLASSQAAPSRVVEWSKSENWLASRQWVLWLARATSVCSLLLIAGLILGMLPVFGGFVALAVVMAINFALSVMYAGAIHDQFNKISTQANESSHYLTLFDRVVNFPATSPRLIELQQRLSATDDGARANIGRLGKIMALANVRRGTLFLLYLVFEFLFFWDVHVLDLLERWKTATGPRVEGWFADLGQWETLAAIARLAADEPEWVWPEVYTAGDGRDAIIAAQQLAHPLLGLERVANNVTVGPAGTVLLVTGSNMSGKSTLLRSLGANAVLALLGAPVCAASMSLPTLKIETSMRIADSLADGVSFFMAELKRLKQIVDTAGAVGNDESRTMLFLLDEILQGTNSRERQIAVSRVVRKLIDQQAIGCISTHDLDLSHTDELRAACQIVHFSEQFSEVDGEKKMTFDYRMQSGVAKTTNALKLLEMVGLGE